MTDNTETNTETVVDEPKPIEYRGPIYNGAGGIDCEINHDDLGWIPYSAHPDDTDNSFGIRVWEAVSQAEDIAPYVPPPPPAVVVPSVTLWERMSDAEAEQVEAAMATQPFRTRQIFMTAQTFRSDHELWPLLESMATQLFGETRASELLAPEGP